MAVQIEFTLNAWAMALGLEPKTLAKKLTQAALPNEGKLSARDVFTALSGEKDASVIRMNNAKAEQLEKENRMRDGELIDLPAAERELWSQLLGPLKQEGDLMPDKLSLLIICEESNRQENKAVLLNWWEDTKNKLMKQK